MAQNKEKFIDLEQESLFEQNIKNSHKRDLDEVNYDEEEDFERNIDNDLRDVNEEELANNLLFQVQSLGRIEYIDGGQPFYLKGKDCMDGIKDLIRACKGDDPEDMIARRILGKWNIVKGDLLQLLLSQHEDKLLSFYLIHLLYYLTESPTLQTKNRELIISYLRSYKENFLQQGVITTLVMHLEQCVKYEGKEKKAKNNMIIAIIGLFRNLLQISDLPEDTQGSNEIQKNLQKKLIITFINEGALDAVQYLASDFTQPYNENNIYDYIEIFYHVFASISIDWLLNEEQEESRVLRLIREENEKIKKETLIQGKRHTRFQSNTLNFVRRFDNTKKLVTDPNAKREDVINKGGQNILKKPQKRKIIFQHVSIFRKQICTDCCIKEEQDEETQEVQKHYLKEHLLQYVQTFLEHSFSPLMQKAYEELMQSENDNDKPDHFDETKIQYYVIMQFFMQFVRKKYLLEKKQNQNIQLDIHDLILCVELTQFELMYKYMLEEVTKKKKATFNYRVFHALSVAFLELLYLVTEMKSDSDQRNRQNATIICNNIFSFEITKILEVGFDYQELGILKDERLKTIAEIIGPYFKLLEKHSKGKIFTVTTNKRLKAKKNKRNKMKNLENDNDELKDFVEKDPNEENDDEDYNPDKENQQQENENQENNQQQQQDMEIENNQDQEEQDEEEAERTTQFQEVQMNINTVFAGIVQYKNLSKIMYLIEKDKILKNSENLNLSIFEYINRIVNKLQADFMFYQIEYLEIIYSILSNNQITSKMYVKQNLVFTLNKIVKNYFTLLKKNELLIVESFFRFQTKDDVIAIQNNYEDLQDLGDQDGEQYDIGEFEDNEEDDDDHMGVTGYRKRWCQAEDRALIDNFDIFKDQDECFEKLEEMLNNLGFYQKRPQDIRKRVKKLKLEQGQDQAKQELIKLYNARMTLEMSVKLLRRNLNPMPFEMDQVKELFNNLFNNYLQYLQDFPQDQYNGRDGVMGCDYAIVPVRKLDFDILSHDLVIQIMECMDFRPPALGEWAWRIPVFVREVDARLYQEKIIQYFEMELQQQNIEDIQNDQNIIDNLQIENVKQKQQEELDNQNDNKNNDNYDEHFEEQSQDQFNEIQEQKQDQQFNLSSGKLKKKKNKMVIEDENSNSQMIYDVESNNIEKQVEGIFSSNENSKFN